MKVVVPGTYFGLGGTGTILIGGIHGRYRHNTTVGPYYNPVLTATGSPYGHA